MGSAGGAGDGAAGGVIANEMAGGQVSMSIRSQLDGVAVNLSFAPAAGIPPVLLNGATAADARAIQEALATG